MSPAYTVRGIQRRRCLSVCPSVCLSRVPLGSSSKTMHFRAMVTILTGNPVLEIESTEHWSLDTVSRRNGRVCRFAADGTIPTCCTKHHP